MLVFIKGSHESGATNEPLTTRLSYDELAYHAGESM
jgi:hypothetical protein